MAEFDAVLGERPNQLERLRDDVTTQAADLLDVPATPGEITEAGVRANVSVGIRYIAAWLQGVERPRSTISWRTRQPPRSRARRSGSGSATAVERSDVERIILEVMAELPDEAVYRDAREVFEKVALHEVFVDFLTMTAYAQLIRNES